MFLGRSALARGRRMACAWPRQGQGNCICHLVYRPLVRGTLEREFVLMRAGVMIARTGKVE
jgi:hypothetical protein